MPYLNEARVMGSMANKPEMAMMQNGCPYCYFAVRMVQKMPDGKRHAADNEPLFALKHQKHVAEPAREKRADKEKIRRGQAADETVKAQKQ